MSAVALGGREVHLQVQGGWECRRFVRHVWGIVRDQGDQLRHGLRGGVEAQRRRVTVRLKKHKLSRVVY